MLRLTTWGKKSDGTFLCQSITESSVYCELIFRDRAHSENARVGLQESKSVIQVPNTSWR